MENRRSLSNSTRAITWPMVLLAIAATATEPAGPRVLEGADIISAFEGKTVAGAYADGLAFRETYFSGGKIDYWDPRATSAGQWSVVNNLFCTFYTAMSGGCFRIVQVSTNCFDFYAAADSTREALDPQGRQDYTARGSIQGIASTCPDELQV